MMKEYNIPLNNARIAMLGDSYTQHGYWTAEVRHFLLGNNSQPNAKIFNCGISGDTMQGASGRLDWDISPVKPTHLFVWLGTNDSQYPRFQHKRYSANRIEWFEVLETYEASLRKIVRDARANHWKLMLGTPISWPKSSKSPYNVERVNSILFGFADIVRRVCKEENLVLVDLNEQMQQVYRAWQGAADEDLFSKDFVHPSKCGYRIIGRLFLNELGFELPVPSSLARAEALLGEWSEKEQQAIVLEQKIRNCAFVEYNMRWDQIAIADQTEKEKIEYWQNYCNQPEIPEWRRNTAKDWLDLHDNVEQLLKKFETII